VCKGVQPRAADARDTGRLSGIMPGPLDEIVKRAASRTIAGRLWLRRGSLFARLRRYGDAGATADGIDAELTASGVDGRTGEVWLTPSWIVGLDGPEVVRIADLAAIGIGPAMAGRWRVVCWEQGATTPPSFGVSLVEGKRLHASLREAAPHLLVSDIDAFAARWDADRLVCEAAALACGTHAHPPAA
jgi:hypothetical protein